MSIIRILALSQPTVSSRYSWCRVKVCVKPVSRVPRGSHATKHFGLKILGLSVYGGVGKVGGILVGRMKCTLYHVNQNCAALYEADQNLQRRDVVLSKLLNHAKSVNALQCIGGARSSRTAHSSLALEK